MSGSFEEDRAGLYALGALNAEEMRAVQIAAQRDPELAAEIAVWEKRLAPLVAFIEPVAPPPSLWIQLEARLLRITGSADRVGEIYQVPVQRSRQRRRGGSRGSDALATRWRNVALGALALSAGLAFALVQKAAPPPQQTAMLIPARPGEGGWLLHVNRNGDIVAEAQGALSRGLDEDYQLWAGEDGSERPVPLGLLSVTGQSVIRAAALPKRHKYLLLVSLEQKGGSRTGSPNGPVRYSSAALSP
jgi:anti-sigma-K factor RskA